MKSKSCETPQHLSRHIEESFTPKPRMEFLKATCNWKDHVARATIKLHGHTQQHCFKIVMDRGTGKPVLYYKLWSRRKTWRGPVHFVKVDKLLDIPGVPGETAFKEVEWNEMETTLTTAIPYFKEHASEAEFDKWLNDTKAQVPADVSPTFVEFRRRLLNTDEDDGESKLPEGALAEGIAAAELSDSDADPEVYIGAYQSRARRKVRPAQVGDLLAVAVEGSAYPFEICRLIEKRAVGSWTVQWYHTRAKTVNGKYVLAYNHSNEAWVQEIEKDSVYHWGFELTSTGRIGKKVISVIMDKVEAACCGGDGAGDVVPESD
jgi:hypothetical protein